MSTRAARPAPRSQPGSSRRLDWHTPAERYDRTPFTARGFERIPSLELLQGWLLELMPA